MALNTPWPRHKNFNLKCIFLSHLAHHRSGYFWVENRCHLLYPLRMTDMSTLQTYAMDNLLICLPSEKYFAHQCKNNQLKMRNWTSQSIAIRLPFFRIINPRKANGEVVAYSVTATNQVKQKWRPTLSLWCEANSC